MLMSIQKSAGFFVGVIFLFTSSLMAQQAIGVGRQFLSRVSVKHREHKGVGYDQGYSTASLFMCPRARQIGLPFLDARLHVFNNSDLASNIGIGARYSDTQETYLFGLNAYYDYRNTRSLISHQASAGIEILSRKMDVRFNGYYPFSGKYQDDPILFSHFKKHSLLVKQKVRYALPCAEADVGFTLPDPFDQIGLYLGFGYYYLFKQEGFNRDAGNVSGGKARLTASPTDYISFGAEYTYDKLFGSRANGFIALNVPLGAVNSYKKKGKHIQASWVQIKTQDVVRNEIIPIVRKQHQFPHLNTEGNPLYFVFVDNKKLVIDAVGSGEGTFEDPYTTLKLGSDRASEGDVVYVFFGDGTSRGYDTGFDFKPKQILTSSGVDLTLNGIVIPALTSNQLPLITNYKGPVIQASYVQQATVNGFRIEAVEDDAIQVEGTALTLKGSSVIAAAKFSALYHIDSIGISMISDNTFYGNGGPAVIDIQEAQGVHKIDYNHVFAQEGQSGIRLENPSHSSYITNNTLSSTDPSGSAIVYRLSKESGKAHQCSYNNLESGFYEAVHIEGESEKESQFQIDNNKFSSGTLVSGISYSGSSLQSRLSITNNMIQVSQTCIAVRDHDGVKTEAIISDNKLFSYSGSPTIVSDISGSANINIENNILKYAKNLTGNFSGIDCHFRSPEIQESNVVISDNIIDMNSKNEGIALKNSHESIVHVDIERNAIRAGSDKGISVINKSSNTLYLNIIDNKSVDGFTFGSQGDGFFEINSTPTSVKGNNNPQGSYILNGNSLKWNSDEQKELISD